MKRQPGDRDRGTYGDAKVLARYGRTRELQSPEQTLFDELGPEPGRLDMLDLDSAADSSDFVLFSYNGIDHLELPERERVLSEMKRVLRPGGVMAFSCHNANFLPVVVDDYRFRLRPSLRETARSLKWALVFNFHNPTLRFRLPLDVGMVKDGLHGFRSSGICYIRPDVQAAALARLGMADIRCAMNDSARFLDGSDPQVAAFASPWVYYSCRKPGQAG